MNALIEQQAQVADAMAGKRLDQVAAQLFPDFSRARLQAWIKDGSLTVNGTVCQPRHKLKGDEILSLSAHLTEQGDWLPESIDLECVYDDDHILILNKPSGLVVHPAAGNRSGTLLNALLNLYPSLVTVPRAGIVHRLDKDTTGLMVVAKTLAAHSHLVNQLQERTLKREYEAVVQGVMTGGGTVEAPIGRHPKHRKKMAVTSNSGKEAITHYRVIQRFQHHTHVRLQLETGRTHQIRVHMAHIHYPLVGDPVYGGRFKIPKGINPQLLDLLRYFSRQALHAAALGLVHPASGEYLQWRVPVPKDMQGLLAQLSQSLADSCHE